MADDVYTDAFSLDGNETPKDAKGGIPYPRTPKKDGSGFQKHVYRMSGGTLKKAGDKVNYPGKITQGLMAAQINGSDPALDKRAWLNGKLTTGGPPAAGTEYGDELAKLLGTGEKRATVFATLASLKASPSIGDNNLTPSAALGALMQTGSFVLLGDGSKATTDGNIWTAGVQADAPDTDPIETDEVVVEGKSKTKKKVSRKKK